MKALTYEEIQQRVKAHGFELLTTRQQWHESRSDHIRVRSASGYEQTRRVDIFALGALQATCQYDRAGRKGETLAVLAASALTGKVLIREYTPPALKGPGYRLDGWAELDGPDGQPVYLALEHQGDHRNNPDAPIHLKRGGAEVSMNNQAMRDAHKAKCLASDPRIVLVTVRDLMLATDRERGVIAIVAQSLEDKMPWLVRDQDYQARKASIMARLAAGHRVLRFPPSWFQEARERVEAALKATGDDMRFSFVDADPMTRTVTLACETHGVLQPVNINNVLGSVDGQRKGTRCPRCANEAFGDSRRLSYEEVEFAARDAGFRPMFGEGQYVNNQLKMNWQCLRDPAHVVRDTLGHIQERGCRHCREESRADERRAAEFNEVSRALGERGDKAISTPNDYCDQDSKIRYRCSLCGSEATQTAAKLKRGQRHGCQRLSSSQATRRERELGRLVEIVKVLGIELLTTAETYAGNRGAIWFRRPDKTEALSAPAYRLRAWAMKARSLGA